MKINCKLIDPDGGVNLAKKKARLGLCENISPKSPDEFPTEGYNDDLSDVPNVDYNMIWKFMVQNVSGKGTSTAKPLIKGYNFFKSGHVVKLEKHNLSENGLCHLRKDFAIYEEINFIHCLYYFEGWQDSPCKVWLPCWH